MRDERLDLINDAFERLDADGKWWLPAYEYERRLAMLVEARAEPAAPYDLLVHEALQGLTDGSLQFPV